LIWVVCEWPSHLMSLWMVCWWSDLSEAVGGDGKRAGGDAGQVHQLPPAVQEIPDKDLSGQSRGHGQGMLNASDACATHFTPNRVPQICPAEFSSLHLNKLIKAFRITRKSQAGEMIRVWANLCRAGSNLRKPALNQLHMHLHKWPLEEMEPILVFVLH